ncbi:DUF4123 domain-containing protein [Ectopseudomonas mendocina]|uniref:DUF4123 domain-containing protein n=1 Tax=Ectopseudomonas mendocina TaxID=300 RepID=A0ABZ2RG03_ECTME
MTPTDWLNAQLAQQRELLLVIDRLAEPDPVQGLFSADLMQDYVNLYQRTAFADLADVGPWLVRLSNPHAAYIQDLLSQPEQHWGWLASAPRVDLRELTQHWQDRLLIEEEQPALYRFQDNRVIARHLTGLTEEQRPLLLGPLSSALYWDGENWQSCDNTKPRFYPAPFDKPWLELAEPEVVTDEVLRHNLTQWLWENHSGETAELAETRLLDEWLTEQLNTAKRWQWHSTEQLQFLVLNQLNPELVEHPAWAPLSGENADTHFARVSKTLAAASPVTEAKPQ